MLKKELLKEIRMKLAYYNAGIEKISLRDYEGAIADFTKAIEIDPNFTWAYHLRGNTKYLLKDSAGAIADFKKVLGRRFFTLGDLIEEAMELEKRIKKEDEKDLISDYTKKTVKPVDKPFSL